MANNNSVQINYLSLIEQGVDAWNEWRASHPEVKPDLSQCYLFEMDLGGVNLRDVILNRTCLIGTNLRGADLRGADLNGAYVSRANLTDANLQGANLSWANFSNANLTNANLTHTIAAGSDFSDACLTGICLEGWHVNAATQFNQATCAYVYLHQQKQERYSLDGYRRLEDVLDPSHEANLAIASNSQAQRVLDFSSPLVPLALSSLVAPDSRTTFNSVPEKVRDSSSVSSSTARDKHRVTDTTRLWSGIAVLAILTTAIAYPFLRQSGPVAPTPRDAGAIATSPDEGNLCTTNNPDQEMQLEQLLKLKAQDQDNFSQECQSRLNELLYRTGLAIAKGDEIRGGDFSEGVRRLCQIPENSSDPFILARSQLNTWYENEEHPEYSSFIASYLRALEDEGKACPAAKDILIYY